MAEETTQPQEPQVAFNPDGSVDLPVDGKPVRFVKEADLLAVKGGAQGKEKEWNDREAKFNTDLAEANRLREETHQYLLLTQAERDDLKENTKDYDTHKTRVGELELELGASREKLGITELLLAQRMTQALVGAGATEETLKDKTLDQLRSLEEAASIFGRDVAAKPAKYDNGKGGGTSAETPLDRAKRILEENEAAGHRMGSRVAAPRTE